MFIYQSLIRLLAPLIWLITLFESIKRKGGKHYLLERLGFGYAPIDGKPIWIHCASVGEVKAVEPLIRSLLDKQTLLITTNTPTGAKLVAQLFANQVHHRYCPLDWPYAINRFLQKTHPTELWVVETEIWPNLYRLVAERKIPISLINARLSRKTLQSPQWLQSAYRQTLEKVSQILTRNHDEADRFIELGADAEKVSVLGNLKYAGLMQLPDYENIIGQDYVLLASSHRSEELAITQLWLSLKRPELLVIVPRHPKRIQEILKDLSPYRQNIAVYSHRETILADTQIYIDDQIGALMALYAHAKLVVMGGSFVAKGGHNILEPAALQAAIITGFDMSDFEMEAAQMKANQGLIQCQNYRELKEQLSQLIDDEARRQQMGIAARQIVLSQQHLLNDYLIALKQKQTVPQTN